MRFDRVAQLFACRDIDLAPHIDHRRAVIVRDFSRELLLQGRENTNTPLIANNIRWLTVWLRQCDSRRPVDACV